MNHSKEKIFKYLIIISFIIFSTVYISQKSGYYEYKNREKVSLTKSQIKKFEKDISEGKNIDITNYIEINKSYQNKISKTGLTISKALEKGIQKIISESFKILSKVMGE